MAETTYVRAWRHFYRSEDGDSHAVEDGREDSLCGLRMTEFSGDTIQEGGWPGCRNCQRTLRRRRVPRSTP